MKSITNKIPKDKKMIKTHEKYKTKAMIEDSLKKTHKRLLIQYMVINACILSGALILLFCLLENLMK
jgi:hypothetical protein